MTNKARKKLHIPQRGKKMYRGIHGQTRERGGETRWIQIRRVGKKKSSVKKWGGMKRLAIGGKKTCIPRKRRTVFIHNQRNWPKGATGETPALKVRGRSTMLPSLPSTEGGEPVSHPLLPSKLSKAGGGSVPK